MSEERIEKVEKIEKAEKAGKKGKSKRVSVWNWMGTLLVMAIPGVNLIALILFLIFAKAQAKRSFCLALLILWLLGIVLTVAAFLIFPDQLAALADYLRQTATEPVVSLPPL